MRTRYDSYLLIQHTRVLPGCQCYEVCLRGLSSRACYATNGDRDRARLGIAHGVGHPRLPDACADSDV